MSAIRIVTISMCMREYPGEHVLFRDMSISVRMEVQPLGSS